MAKYIPLDAVLAEIEKIIADETESIKCFERRRNVSEVQRSNARIGVLMYLRALLDTLEVKEIDLEKELVSWRNNHFHGRRDKEASGEYLERVSQLDLAKHCFELGLKAQQEPISENLEEAAIQFATDTKTGKVDVVKQSSFFWGAIYHKQQMVAKAVDARCFGFQGDALFSFRLPPDKYLVGSEVKVIVIKED